MTSLSRFRPRAALAGVLSVIASAFVSLAGAASSPASATVTVTGHFIFTTTSSNVFSYLAFINNAATNGHPNALLFVTLNDSPGGECGCVADSSPIAVAYASGPQEWAIMNENQASMPVGVSFNVLVVQKPSANAFVVTSKSANTSSGETYVNSTLTNGHPGAQLLVTQNADPGGTTGFQFNNHPVGVAYSDALKKWGVLEQDFATMPLGVHFNVMIGAAASNGGRMILQRATTSNIAGDSFVLNDPESVGNPNAAIFETVNYNPGAKGGTLDPTPTGVLYYLSPTDDNAIYNTDGSSMPLNAAFNVLIFPS